MVLKSHKETNIILIYSLFILLLHPLFQPNGKMNETDEEISRRYLENNTEDDFRILFDRHSGNLTLFIKGFVGDIGDAEEIMIDAFAEAAAGTSAYRAKSSFKTWLFSIGKHLALKHLRRAETARRHEPDIDGEAAESPEMTLITEERSRRLYQALDSISPEYRQVLYLIFFEEMPVEDAAHVMGRSRKQIYNLVERGKKALKKQLEAMGINDAQ